MSKDIVISGIKPSGELHLGTLCGSILPFVQCQDLYNLNVFIADIHALTKPIAPNLLKKYTEELILTYLAVGLNPQKVNIFKQSDIAAHAQLSQILTCYLDVSDLTKMPQYKNYIETHKGEAVPAGMLDYVNWMNADILLYSPMEDNLKLKVICGSDQLPHIYLCQEVARRFNKIYGETFKIPEPIISKVGAKIMSLSDPTKKMSKSESDKGTIYLLDDEETVRRKIKKAMADSEGKIYYNPETKPGISNLLVILSCLSGKSISELEEYYKDKPDYGKFKSDVADAVWEELSKLQTKIAEIKASNLIAKTLESGFCNAVAIANNKIEEVYKKVGLR